MRMVTKGRIRAQGRNPRRSRKIRGGNADASLSSIIDKFDLVKRSYDDVYDMEYFDDALSEFKDAIEDCCYFKGELAANSIVVGKTDDGASIVLVGKNADKDLIDRLEKIGESVKVYVLDDDIGIVITSGWDYDGGKLVTSFGLTFTGEVKLRGSDHDISLIISGDKRKDWENGSGDLQLVTNVDYEEHLAGQKRFTESSLMALSRLNLDRELGDIVGEGIRQARPRVRHVEISHSSLYTPSGDLGKMIEFDDQTKETIEEGRKKYHEFLDEQDERMKQDYEYRMSGYDQEEPDSPPYYDSDGYYGGKKRNGKKQMKHRRTSYISQKRRRSASRRSGSKSRDTRRRKHMRA